ncbi:MAG: ABC transporter substrate-binding protein [Acidobacteriota bacterium]|nr:ABC transporter substrate-binding protein [Acidobacteriota bacterium]
MKNTTVPTFLRRGTQSTWLFGTRRFLAIVAVFAFAIGCYDRAADSGAHSDQAPRRLKIGIQVSPAMTLLMVAKDRGYFQAEGLDVELTPFTAGKFALQAFLAKSVDLAVAGDVPAALAILQGHDIRVVSQVVDHTTNEVRVVALRDAEASDARTYFKTKRRKLATSIGGGPEFFTHEFLRHYGIAPSEVDIISQKPEDMPAALAAKSVDAIAIFDPFAYLAEQRVGADAVTFSDRALYSELYVLVASPNQVLRERATLMRLIRALKRAETFIASDPTEAKAILMRYTKLDAQTVDAIWKNFAFGPALTGQLAQYWRAEEVWAREANKVAANAPTPDFGKHIDPSILRDALPSSPK